MNQELNETSNHPFSPGLDSEDLPSGSEEIEIIPPGKKKRHGITRIAGVWVHPPKKKTSRIGKRNFTMRFVFTGIIPSKKNNQVPKCKTVAADKVAKQLLLQGPITNMEQCRMIYNAVTATIVPNNRHQKWERKMTAVLWEQRKAWAPHLDKRGIMLPIRDASMSIQFQWKDPKDRDNSNKQQSIEDILIATGIIASDSYKVLSPITTDANCYRGEIREHTTIVHLTAYF